MTAPDFDELELSVHHEAWQKVEDILDQQRRKIRVRAVVSEQGQLRLDLPVDVPPGDYDITLLIDLPKQDA